MTKEYSITTVLLSPNPYSRPRKKINKTKGIVIHWVANPKSSARANRNYFENRKHGKTGYGSAHEIIGLDGEIVKCIPDDEMAYHVGSKTYTQRALTQLSTYPNNCTYGIECTHPDWNGKFNTKTYTTLINRVADLCIKFNLTPSKDTIWRHYDVVGWKDCPRYYVKNPNAWDKLILDVIEKYNEKIISKKEVVNVGSIFKDVPDDRWSAPYIKAAKELGIITGVGDGNYNPTGPLTREQGAVLMVRLYEKITGKKVVK